MKVLVVGIGGLGCPAAMVLARAGIAMGIADDDDVDATNLHRQILFTRDDVGKSKVLVAAEALRKLGAPSVEAHQTRLLPTNAIDLISRYDLVIEGSDNFPTKFLTADACYLAGRPVVHAAAVRWHGTALAVAAKGGPCYRCLFEDVPRENVPNCVDAGVMGPVVGVVAAAQADLALSMLEGDLDGVAGTLVTFDGKTLALRRRQVARRAACDLCGGSGLRAIVDIHAPRYRLSLPL